MTALRFLAVALGGLAIDIAVALALHAVAGIALPLAAAGGFVVASMANYLAHELWTFPGNRGGLSALRGGAYVGVSLITLAVRVAAVAAGSVLLGSQGWRALTVLVLASGVSFMVNFALSRTVFRPAGAAP